MTDSAHLDAEPQRPPLSSGVIAVSAFTAAYTLAACAAAIIGGNTEFIFYIVVMGVLIGVVWMIHRAIRLPTALLWALSIWGGLHMAGGIVPVPESWPINGDVRVLYSWWIIPRADGDGGWLKFDHVVHAYGFGVATWLCWETLRWITARRSRDSDRIKDLKPTAGILLLCVMAATGFGALNEVIEFTATLFAETNVGGYTNTALDLVSNLAGAVIAAIIIRLRV